MKTLIVALLATAFAVPVFAAPTYRITGAIAGADGSWDYASVNTETNQLYVAHGDQVMAVDLASNKVSKLAAAGRPHSVLPIPHSGALLETDGTTGTAQLIDAQTGAVRWAVKTGEKPDAAVSDPAGKRAVVVNAKTGTLSVLDIAAGKLTGTLTLKPGLEYATIDRRGTLWVNNEITNTLTPVDLGAMTVGTPIALQGCEEPSGLAYAAKLDQLVSVCGNGTAAVVDAAAHKVVTMLPIGKGPDAALLDEKRGVIAVPCGEEGVLTILDISGDAIKVAATIPTEKSARTGAIDPVTGKIYLPSAQFLPPVAPDDRGKLIPGSFHVIVLSPDA